MPIEIKVDLYTVTEAVGWLNDRGHSMPGGQEITYKLFMNYLPTLRRRGLEPVKFGGRQWLIPETQLTRLEEIWTRIAE